MKAEIQTPSLGRIVLFTAQAAHVSEGGVPYPADRYAGLITNVKPGGVIDVVTFGPRSTYHHVDVPYHPSAASGTWAYPEHVGGKIEVEYDTSAEAPPASNPGRISSFTQRHLDEIEQRLRDAKA